MRHGLKLVPVFTVVLHAILFIATAVYVQTSSDGQAPLVWVLRFIPDMPFSLLYDFEGQYSHLLSATNNVLLQQILYLPYVIHGLLGTAWWYAWPRLVIGAITRLGLLHTGRSDSA